MAAEDLGQALALRSRDYRLWIEMEELLDKSGDTNSAVAALFEARKLAPYDFGVRWDLALLLQKLGRHDEAFREFRMATSTLPSMLSMVIENAWETYAGNCAVVQSAVNPRTPRERLMLARFFIEKNRPVEAMNLIQLTDNLPVADKQQLTRDFLNARQFAEAYEIWSEEHVDAQFSHLVGTINDGGFESQRLSNEPGFTWVIEELPGVSVSVDKENPHSGASSLCLNWNGNPDPAKEIVSQLVRVEPNTGYELNFGGRAKDLITGGPPVITITDANQPDNHRLAESSLLSAGSEWKNFGARFVTSPSTRAVRIALRRQTCKENTCPIFGTLWLDDFRLSQKTGTEVSR